MNFWKLRNQFYDLICFNVNQVYAEVIEKTDLQHKSKDFEHLLFSKENKDKILNFSEFIGKL